MKTTLMFALHLLMVSGLYGQDQHGQDPRSVTDFARQHWVEGVPFAVARRYEHGDVPPLVEMLRDASESKYWPNVVGIMGMIGCPCGTSHLIDFLEQDLPEGGRDPEASRRLAVAASRAKTSVLRALGLIAYLSEDEAALAYLIESVRPGVWRDRGVEWLGPHYRSDVDRDMALQMSAIVGLATSGHAAAKRRLHWLRDSGLAPATVIAEAIEMHDEIKRRGLDRYFTKGPGK